MEACVEELQLSAVAADAPQPAIASPSAAFESATSGESLNQKVRLLRSLLSWEEEDLQLPGGSKRDQKAEVVVIVLPKGCTLSLPAGSCARDAAELYRPGVVPMLVMINGTSVDGDRRLEDGDVVLLRFEDEYMTSGA